jgi:electron transfer flavoprotein beta subunit
MKVLVAVKQVARLREDFELSGTEALAADALELELNEWDAHALEAAVQLVEASPEDEVVVVTVADELADEVLLRCLAAGADRGARVWDPALEEADPLAVAAVLAAFAAAERPDLILCGAQSSDAANAATGVALAGLLGLAHVAVVTAIAHDGERLTVHRELEGGMSEVLRLSLPALLTVQTGINAPRQPTLRQRKHAREKALAALTLADIDLSAEDVVRARGARTLRLVQRPRDGGAELLEGEPAEIAARIADIIRRALPR